MIWSEQKKLKRFTKLQASVDEIYFETPSTMRT